VAEWSVLWLLIHEDLGSNLDPEIGYPDWGFLWFSLVPLGKCWDGVLDQVTTTSFCILFNQLLINHLTIQHCVLWATNSIFKYTINKWIKWIFFL
jgi:hypothetical protein